MSLNTHLIRTIKRNYAQIIPRKESRIPMAPLKNFLTELE